METCSFCGREARDSRYVQPNLCEKHIDLILMIHWLRGAGLAVTLKNLAMLLPEMPEWLSISAEELPAVWEEYLKKQGVNHGH